MHGSYKEINAVYENDLDRLLSEVGLLTDFNTRNLKCKFCKGVVTRKNIYSVIKDSDRHKLVCSKAQCVSALMEFLDLKRQGVPDNG